MKESHTATIIDITRTQSENKPNPLVSIIRKALAKAELEHQTNGYKDVFDPVEWLSDRLGRGVHRAMNRSNYLDDPGRIEAINAEYVWEAISHPHIKDRHLRKRAKVDTLNRARFYRFITLSSQYDELITAMAQAVGIPFTGGQSTYDLLSTPALQKKFKKRHPDREGKMGIPHISQGV